MDQVSGDDDSEEEITPRGSKEEMLEDLALIRAIVERRDIENDENLSQVVEKRKKRLRRMPVSVGGPPMKLLHRLQCYGLLVFALIGFVLYAIAEDLPLDPRYYLKPRG